MLAAPAPTAVVRKQTSTCETREQMALASPLPPCVEGAFRRMWQNRRHLRARLRRRRPRKTHACACALPRIGRNSEAQLLRPSPNARCRLVMLLEPVCSDILDLIPITPWGGSKWQNLASFGRACPAYATCTPLPSESRVMSALLSRDQFGGELI